MDNTRTVVCREAYKLIKLLIEEKMPADVTELQIWSLTLERRESFFENDIFLAFGKSIQVLLKNIFKGYRHFPLKVL